MARRLPALPAGRGANAAYSGHDRRSADRPGFSSTTIGMHRARRRVVSSPNNENRSPFGVGGKVANLEGAALVFRGWARVRDNVAAAGIERGHTHGSGLDDQFLS